MKIRVTADLHGNTPEIEPCDLLIIAGDVCPDNEAHVQRMWLRTKFHGWLRELPAEHIVWIAGNHDFVCEAPGFYRTADKLPGHYLFDTSVEVGDLKIHGTPWVPNLPSWAFHAEDPMLQERFARIPEDADIVVPHGPPHGILDQTLASYHVGARQLASRLQIAAPKLCVFGHIHEAFGTEKHGETIFCNAAYVDDQYKVRGIIPEFNL